MAVQQYLYTTPSNYTYDSGKIEVTGGIAKLKEDLSNVYVRYHLESIASGDNISDSSGNNRDATAMNNPTVVVGKLNNGIQFGAVNDQYIDCGDIAGFDLDNSFSFEIWAKPSPASRTRYLFGKGTAGNGIGIYIESDGDVRAELESNNSTRSIYRTVDVNVEDSAWHHIIVTYNGSRLLSGLIVYVDNIIPTTLNSNDNIQGTDTLIVSQNLTIGASNNGSLNTFRDGILDEAVIYDRVLTPTEVAYKYNSGTGRENFIYFSSNIPIEPTNLFDPITVQNWNTFSEILGGGNQGSIGYNLYKVDKVNKYYWNGSAWVTGGSSNNYNSVSTINTNISTFDGSPDKIGFIAYLISDGEQQVELDENQITYTAGSAPLVDAGTNKIVKDNQSIAPFSDCTFSDPDGQVIKAEYKVDGEVDVWTEILQGGYGTLLEAVQNFNYQFNNLGVLTVRLQVTDNQSGGGFSTEDSLTVTVSQYTKIVNIQDATTLLHLSSVLFDPDDGSDPAYKNSPFSYSWDFGSYDITMEKIGYNAKQQTVSISDETDLDLVLTEESVLDQAKASVGLLTALDSFRICAWLERNGGAITNPTSCEIWLIDSDSVEQYHPSINSNPNSSGIFVFNKTPSLLPDAQVYTLKIQIIYESVTYVSILPVNKIKRDKVFVDGHVHIDVSNGEIGTAYPIGTASRPVNNFSDAKIIADANFIKEFHIDGTLNILITENITDFTFVNNYIKTNEIILNGSNSDDTVFQNIKISGTLNGITHAHQCFINNLINFQGLMMGCILEGNMFLTGTSTVHLIDCRSGVPGTSTPTIDMGGSGRGLGVRAYAGGLKITNLTGAENISLDFISGQVQIDSTCTNGTIVIRGNCTVVDNSGSGCTVINQSIQTLVSRVLGLTQENFRIFSPVHDSNNNLTSATIKIYPSKTDTDADTNIIDTYSMNATYDGNGNIATYKVTKD